jgi:phosphoadenosine phosphosulfate reductase
LALIEDKLESLNSLYRGRDAAAIISHAAREAFPGRIAFVSSFGAESAVLLHLMALVDPSIPVLFLDTNKLFGETVRYRSRLQHQLGLEDVRVIGPRKSDLQEQDPQGVLSMEDPDACCRLRKTEPLTRALKGFECWATGRKRHQTQFRKEMDFVEHDGRSFKINPLAEWARADIADYFAAHKLPEHPLVRQGYFSIGCMPCTSKVVDENDARSGRWSGQAKTECGIHSPKK